MKTWIYILVGALLGVPVLTSCEKDLPVYVEEQGRLNFIYEKDLPRDSMASFSFKYGPAETTIDTVWLGVRTMGIPSEHDRPLALQQLMTGNDDAVSGVHYVPFDDSELVSKFYYVPAGAIEVQIPIVVKRDASLQDKNYTLRVGFKPNDAFGYGSREFSFKRIIIADRLVEPKNWKNYCDHFFNDYGPVKHQFMIDVTGEKWDDEYVDTVIWAYLQTDQNYLFYMSQRLYRALQEYNATHDEPLCEEGNIPVEFTFGGGFE